MQIFEIHVNFMKCSFSVIRYTHILYISLLVSNTTFEIFKITFLGWEEKRALHAALRISQRNTSSEKNWRIQFINYWSYNDYGKNINIRLFLNQNNDLSLVNE